MVEEGGLERVEIEGRRREGGVGEGWREEP